MGDTVEEAIADAKTAAFHIEGMIAENMEFEEQPRSIAQLRQLPEYAEAAWVVIEVDEAAFSRPVRLNVSRPEYLLQERTPTPPPVTKPAPDFWPKLDTLRAFSTQRLTDGRLHPLATVPAAVRHSRNSAGCHRYDDKRRRN